MFILFSNVLSSVFISSMYPVVWFRYYCRPCLLPSHVILMTALKKKKKRNTTPLPPQPTNKKPNHNTKNPYNPPTPQKTQPPQNPTGKQFGIKVHVWIKQCIDYKLNCCNSSKMFPVAVSWWKSILVGAMELLWLGRDPHALHLLQCK